jgi:hypothetical protein
LFVNLTHERFNKQGFYPSRKSLVGRLRQFFPLTPSPPYTILEGIVAKSYLHLTEFMETGKAMNEGERYARQHILNSDGKMTILGVDETPPM